MTGKERIANILNHKPVDRIGLYEHFWSDTYKEWSKPAADGGINNLDFNFDIVESGVTNMVGDLDFADEIVAETEDTITIKNGNYATLKKHKKHDATPEHVGFDVDCREKWERLIKPKLTNKADFERRIDFESYRNAKRAAAERQQFFMWSGVNVFELMHPVCGHVNMLMAMIDDPDWVVDMCKTYSELTVEFQKILFAREGYPDGIWFYEDMGYKNSPFMSPAMYDEFIYPAHKYTCDYAKSVGLPVIMHSCGFVEPLLPGMVRAGINALQVIEIKAGMDLLRIHAKFGDQIALIGGIDVRKLYTNDYQQIDAELEAKIPKVMQGFGYVLHSDHSIPKTVKYETYKYFMKKGLELGTY